MIYYHNRKHSLITKSKKQQKFYQFESNDKKLTKLLRSSISYIAKHTLD